MSFLSDLVEGHFSNLGTDISHAGSSLLSHPSELYETLGGAAALATGGLALGALAPEAGAAAGGGSLFSGLFGGGDAAAGAFDIGAATQGSDIAAGIATDPLYGGAAGADPLAYAGGATNPLTDASGGLGVAQPTGGAGLPSTFGGQPIGTATATDPAFATDPYAGGNPALGANPSQGGGMIGPPAPAGSTGFLSSLNPSNWTLGGVGKVAGVAAAGAGLGMNLLNRGQMDPNQAMLAQQAAQLGQSGQVLESYLKTGKLPPALQAQLDQAVAAEKARIVSGYAAKGMPTDPNQNSALAQDLNNVQTNAIAAMANVQVEMMNTGLKETGLSSQLYQMLTQLDLQQNKDLMSAISSFAAALGGGMGGGQNVKLSLA
jgi:hypothetical protein